MPIKRKIVKVSTPLGQPGFLGPGHTARPVVSGNFSETDPFIFLMDDILDKKDNEPVGGPHPHAGFETVTLVIEGELGEGEHSMKAGDFQMMTAGSGIVHTETIEKKTKLRIFQLWLSLPKKDRWVTPRLQELPLEHVPVLESDGVRIKLYSGHLAGISSPTLNYTPMILADISIDKGRSTVLQIPASYNSFLYIIGGSMSVGADQKQLKQDQVGWLSITGDDALSDLSLTAGDEGVRFVLYAGKPTGDPIVSYGPFIGNNTEDIKRLYEDYRQGKMNHITSVPENQRILL